MKKKLMSWLSSRLFSFVPMVILMAMVNDCTRSDVENPFAQTNKGRDIVAYRIDGEEHVSWDHNFIFGQPNVDAQVFYTDLGLNQFTVWGDDIYIRVNSLEALKIGKKYFVSDKFDDANKYPPVLTIETSNRKATSGWFTFRYFKDGIAAGNFEAEFVADGFPHNTIIIKDGTFDVRY